MFLPQAMRQRNREAAEEQARSIERSGDKYQEALAEAARHHSTQEYLRAAKAYREAISLEPDDPTAYFNLGSALSASGGHDMEAAQRYLEAKERWPVGSELWAQAMAKAFDTLQLEQCADVAKPEWWDDEGIKALSARVVRAAPTNDVAANGRLADALSGQCCTWEAGPRSAAELTEAAVYFDRTEALCDAPAQKAALASNAGWCRQKAAAMSQVAAYTEIARGRPFSNFCRLEIARGRPYNGGFRVGY